MQTSRPITVKLDRDRQIQFTQRALFRMGTLPTPFDLEDLGKRRKVYASIVGWLWACLVPADALDFASPEDLAAHVSTKGDALTKLASALADAINSGAADLKNADSSTPGPSPASS